MEGVTASRYPRYDEAIGMDIEVVGLIVENISVKSSNIACINVHVEPVLCKYRCDRWCNAEHQSRRSHYPGVILIGYYVAGPKKRLRPVRAIVRDPR